MRGCLVFCGALLLGVALSIAGVRARLGNPRTGWNLMPVVVAAVDIPAGDILKMENISQRSIPEQFVTTAYVTPDQVVPTIDKQVSIPIMAGEPVTWSAFADLSRHAAVQDCATAIKPAVDAKTGGADQLAASWFEEHQNK